MDTAVQENPDRNRYELTLDGEVVGSGDYELDGDTISFTHTNVDPDHGGKGLAKVLVTHELQDSRDRGRSVLPVCTYVRKVIAENPEKWLDLVPSERRADYDLPA